MSVFYVARRGVAIALERIGKVVITWSALYEAERKTFGRMKMLSYGII